MIVGWIGATPETLLSALNEAASENANIPVSNYPDVITVLKRRFSVRLVGKKEFIKGQIPRDDVRWVLVPEDLGAGWPLVWLLNQLSAGSGWAAMFSVDLQPYWEKAT